jgi:hypothetical protein
MSDPLHSAISHAIDDELDTALGRITHCIGQLTEEQVWRRPPAGLNAIGNLLLHLTGNVRQLILSGVGGEPDARDRPAEFAARDPLPKAELVRRLSEVVALAIEVVAAASADDLCGIRRVKANNWTGLQSIIRCVAHFRGHTQEIIHMTRTLLGDEYAYAGQR